MFTPQVRIIGLCCSEAGPAIGQDAWGMGAIECKLVAFSLVSLFARVWLRANISVSWHHNLPGPISRDLVLTTDPVGVSTLRFIKTMLFGAFIGVFIGMWIGFNLGTEQPLLSVPQINGSADGS